MKLKRSKLLPAALLLYLAAMAIYAWPNRIKLGEVQYWATIGITIVCIIVLTYFLRRREKFREENIKNK